MENRKYLNEEDYQKNKKKITKIAFIVLILGVLIGGSLIATGLIRQNNVNSQYSEENKADLQKQIDEEKQNLLIRKTEIEQEIQTTINGIQTQIDKLNTELVTLKTQKQSEFHSNGFSEKYYSLENDIDKKETEIRELKLQIEEEKEATSVIDDALDDSFSHCSFEEAKNNAYTSKYCSLKNQLDDMTDFNKSFASSKYIPFYVFGAFIIFASCMIAGSIYMFAKRREIMAFTTQQVMPVAQEGIDTMAPTIGNVAKEISKGIKDGIKDEKE